MKAVVSFIALPFLAVTFIYSIFQTTVGFSYDSGVDLLAHFSTFFIALLCLYAFLQIMQRKKQAIFFKVTIYTLVIICILSVLAVGTGYIEDTLGYQCSGFFNTAISCTSNRLLLLNITILSPYVIILLGLVSLFALQQQISVKENSVDHHKR